MGTGGGHKAPPSGVLGALRALDAFPKVNEDFFQKTMSGGIITMIAYSFMVLLFVSETRERRERLGARRATASVHARRLQRCMPCVLPSRWHAHPACRPFTPCSFPDACNHLSGLYLAVHRSHELVVDSSRGETISINVSERLCMAPTGAGAMPPCAACRCMVLPHPCYTPMQKPSVCCMSLTPHRWM